MGKILLIIAGWLAVLLGLLGIFLPVLPTTPFLILAASLFAKSSTHFHQWLINSPLFGPIIKDWEETRCISSGVKYWALLVVAITFSISIYTVPLLWVRCFLLISLLACLFFIWRIPECRE